MDKFVLGVDGGNTKTIALVARTDGAIVGWGRSGNGDIYGAGSPEAALRSIEDAVTSALASAGVERAQLCAGAFSLAGADWAEDFELLQTELQQRHLGETITVVNDAMGALRAGSPDGTGIVVVCGTGAGTGARSPDGKIWHSSWWQFTQGSQELARQALRAVYLADLGIAPATSLTPRFLEFMHAAQVEEILHRLTARNKQPFEVAKLARVLMSEAEAGDPVARNIVIAHASALGDYANVAARKVGIAHIPFYLVLTGSVLRSPARLLAHSLIARVHANSPEAIPIYDAHEPVVGALWLAFDALNIRVNDARRARTAATLPPRSLFET